MTKSYDRIRLGVSHLVWGFELSDQSRFELFLDDAAAIGYEGVLAFDATVAPWLDRPAEFKVMLDKRGLTLAGVILRPGIDFLGTDKLTRFMAACDGDILVMSGRDGTQAEWKIVIPALQRHGEIAAANGIRAVYHHHTGWIAETMEQTERLLAETDRRYLGAMLDCGHATKDFVGHSAEEYFERNHAVIDYIEFKDWSPATDLRTEVGRGLCNWPAVASAIKQHGYKGWIVTEQNQSISAPKVAAAESFHYARHILGLA